MKVRYTYNTAPLPRVFGVIVYSLLAFGKMTSVWNYIWSYPGRVVYFRFDVLSIGIGCYRVGK